MPARGLRWRADAGKFAGGSPQENPFAVAPTCCGRDIRMDALRPEFRRRDRQGDLRLSAAFSIANPAGADLDLAGCGDLEIGLPALRVYVPGRDSDRSLEAQER